MLRCVLDVDAHVRKVAASGRIAPSPKLTSLSRDLSTPDSTRNSSLDMCALCLVAFWIWRIFLSAGR